MVPLPQSVVYTLSEGLLHIFAILNCNNSVIDSLLYLFHCRVKKKNMQKRQTKKDNLSLSSNVRYAKLITHLSSHDI